MPPYDIENYFNKLTKTHYYWLGFLWADGCIDIDENKSWYRLRLALSEKDKEHLEKFKKFIAPSKPLYFRKSNNSWSFEINNETLIKNLSKLGITVKRSTLSDNFGNIPKKFLTDFIRGYFDGDGTIGIYRLADKRHENYFFNRIQLRMVLVNKNLTICMSNFLKELEIDNTYFKESKRDVWHISISSKIGQNNFIKRIYGNKKDVKLERKYETATRALEILKDGFTKNHKFKAL